jgi:hypothetical protein
MTKKGEHLSEEHKRKISKTRIERGCALGDKNPMFGTVGFWRGKPLPEEMKTKISASHKGKKQSLETRKKIGNSNRGKKSRLGKRHSEETKLKISNSRKGKLSGDSNPNFGKCFSEETRYKLSVSHKGLLNGENHPNWKGGISFEPYCIKFTKEFKERVRAFFGYRCAECGVIQTERKFDVHHVNFNKETCCDQSIPLFVPLCRSCHTKTQNNRPFWEYWFTEMVKRTYGGKCYFTKEEMIKII